MLNEDKDSLIKDVASIKDQFDTFKNSLDIDESNQLKAAFAKVKAENIELMRKVESLEIKLKRK
ncbi:MAG: hypothetical protein V8S74_11670 [Lachnospirales bacterium]